MHSYKAIFIKPGQSAQDSNAETKTIEFYASSHRKADSEARIKAFDLGLRLVSAWAVNV